MLIHLSKENEEKYNAENITVLFDFSAKWCGPCRAMKPHLEKASDFLANTNLKLDFVVVDVDEYEDFSIKYDVRCMPTLILLKRGKIVARKEGMTNADALLLMIGQHFDIKDKNSEESDSDEEVQIVRDESTDKSKEDLTDKSTDKSTDDSTNSADLVEESNVVKKY
jgi:thioredoxin 1